MNPWKCKCGTKVNEYNFIKADKPNEFTGEFNLYKCPNSRCGKLIAVNKTLNWFNLTHLIG